jgi:hypothetical protein
MKINSVSFGILICGALYIDLIGPLDNFAFNAILAI